VGVGGGGGGSGNGKGGISFQFGDANGFVAPTDGGDGSTNLSPSDSFGAAGTSALEGTASHGNSGNGGTWGQPGTAGTAAGSGYTVTGTLTAGGAAGNAIELNGGGITITPSGGAASPYIEGVVS
jgi:hypothetical protein